MKRQLDSRVMTMLALTLLGFVVQFMVAQRSWAQDSQERQIEKLIETLQTYQFAAENDTWASAIYELVEIGEPAVVPLIEALDATSDDKTLRALGFTLRAIGDARAIPALIRAVPRTLREPGSDIGVRTVDQDLFEFMLKNDVSDSDDRDSFTMGRPVREICCALMTITATDQGDRELFHVTLRGSARQRWAQRKLYHDLAGRWQEWWAANWRSHLMDPGYSDVDLAPFEDARPDAVADGANPFPTGANVAVGGGLFGLTINPICRGAYACFVDLDTMRISGFPVSVLLDSIPDDEVDDAVNVHAAELAEFCGQQGLELQGQVIRLEGDDHDSYVIRAHDMRVWRIDDSRFERLADEVRLEQPLELGELLQHGQPLTEIDKVSGRPLPNEAASFLFVTSNGTTGSIQIRGEARRDSPRHGVVVNVAFIYRTMGDE